MKQLVILSGKGGTGKTCLCAAFAHLGSTLEKPARPVLADADVDAANLSLVLQPEPAEAQEFWGGSLALIDTPRCTGCGACVAVCRYDALHADPAHEPALLVDPIACDGCAACVYACPEGAIRMVPQQEGHWFHSKTPYGDLFHAELFPGRENSGKLVTLVKQQARLWADDTHAPLVIIDGPPGIGCPVISACAGSDLGLVVAEPGVAGQHDLRRILGTLQHFRVPAAVCINKADIHPEGAAQIRDFAAGEGIEVVAEIPYDDLVPQAMLQGAPVTALFPGAPASQGMQKAWEWALARLAGRQEE